MNRCHRCGVTCDAYQHEARLNKVDVLTFCTFFCAQFWHFATGFRVYRTATGEIVFEHSRPRVENELQGHDYSKTGFQGLFDAVESVSNGRYEMEPPIVPATELDILDYGDAMASAMKKMFR
jgi:hypothetical protein